MAGTFSVPQVARRLHRVGVEEDAPFPAHRADLRDGQNGANLVISVHDAHQSRVFPDGLLHLPGGNASQCSHGEKLHLEALGLQLFQGMQNGVMLKGSGDDVPFALSSPQ